MTEATSTQTTEAGPVTAVTGPALRSLGLLLAVVCSVQFLDAMDIASMGPALPLVQHDLHMSPSALQWVVSAYALGFGGFLLLGGRLADLFDRKKLLIGFLLVFVIASGTGGLADNSLLMVAARLVKGVTAGFTAPAAMAVLLDAFREEQARNRALGTFLAVASAGYSLGLLLGGLLAGVDWRLIFFLPAAAGLIIAVLASIAVPAGTRAAAGQRLDVLGAITVTGGAVALVYALSRAADTGWGDTGVIASLVGAALLFLVFVLVERRHSAPLVPLTIFSRPGLVRANLGMLFFGGYVAFQFVLTLYYQEQLHWSPFQAGLAFLIGGVLTAGTARYGAALAGKYGPWPVASVGLVMLSAGYLFWVLTIGHLPALAPMLVQQLLGGFGFAAVYPALNIAAVGSAREDEQGLASGLFNAGAQIGNGIVVAVVATVFTVGGSDALGGYRVGLWTVTGITLAVTLMALGGAARARRLAAEAATA